MSQQHGADQHRQFPSLAGVGDLQLPDLARIPKAQWRAALAPLSALAREYTIRHQRVEISMEARDVLVNARLYDRDFRRLQEAARLLGVKPSELARTFIVRGTARVLAENEHSRRQP